ncbi:nucleotide-binding alpha-beta plait domain-containing protein [Tanacetum coccineum]
MVTGSKQGGEGEEQDKGEGQEKRKHVPQSNVVNYYFTNFPPKWNEDYLRKAFAEVEELVDVYVARKMSKAGLRFGFVRFLQVGNPKVLEKNLNQIRYGRFKLRANIAKFERYSSKFRPECKQTNSSNWLEKAQVGESILIHSPSQLLSICGFFNVSNCKVENLGGMRIILEFRNKEGEYKTTIDSLKSAKSAEVGEEVKHTFDHRSDTIDTTEENNVEGGFNSNSGAVRGHLCGKDVFNDNPMKHDSKHIEKEAESEGKGDKFIFDSPAIGVTGLIFSHDGDGNHGDDGSGDVEEVVIEKVAPDVDISQLKRVVTVSDTKKILDPTFEKVVTGLKKHSNLNVFKYSDDMGYSKTKAHRNKLKSLAPSGPRSLKKDSKYKDPSKIKVGLGSFNKLMCPRKKKKNLLMTYMERG